LIINFIDIIKIFHTLLEFDFQGCGKISVGGALCFTLLGLTCPAMMINKKYVCSAFVVNLK